MNYCHWSSLDVRRLSLRSQMNTFNLFLTEVLQKQSKRQHQSRIWYETPTLQGHYMFNKNLCNLCKLIDPSDKGSCGNAENFIVK